MRFLRSAGFRLGVSLAVGILIAVFSWFLIKRERMKIQSQTVRVRVLRAKTYLKSGRPLTEKDVLSTAIPGAFLEPTAVTTVHDLFDSSGRPLFRTKIGLQKNEQITRSKLVDKRTALGLSWILKPGETAVSVRLNADQAVGGWIRPGDAVRVFATLSSQPGWPNSQTVLLIDQARVLAVNDAVWYGESSLNPPDLLKPVEKDDILLTLATSPGDAGKLALAVQKGVLQMNLLPALGDVKSAIRRIRLADLK